MRRVIILVHLPRTNQVVFNCSSFKSATSSCNNLYFCSCMQVLYLFAVFAGDITVRVMYANYLYMRPNSVLRVSLLPTLFQGSITISPDMNINFLFVGGASIFAKFLS